MTPRVMLRLDFENDKIRLFKILLPYMLTIAATLIAKKWNSVEIPDIREWLEKMRYMGLLCKLSAMCKYRTGQVKVKKTCNRMESFLNI